MDKKPLVLTKTEEDIIRQARADKVILASGLPGSRWYPRPEPRPIPKEYLYSPWAARIGW